MALQTKYCFPTPPYANYGLDTSTLLVDASGEKAAVIFTIQRTGTLDHVGFRTGAVVQTQTIKVSFQDPSTTTGDPDETIDQYRTISIADTDDNVWKDTGIISSDGTDTGTKRSVTRGDQLAIVWESNSFTAGDVFRLSSYVNNNGFVTAGAYADLKAGAGPTWTKQSLSPVVALYYDDGLVYYLQEVLPISAATTMNFNSGSSPAKRGLKFQVPFPCKTMGLKANLSLAAGANFVCKLYDSDGSTVLQTTASHDGDIIRSSGSNGVTAYWPTDQALVANTNYFIMVEPSTANNVTLSYVDVNAAALLDQMEGGQQFHFVDNSGGGGSFVATTTRRPTISVLFSAFDDAATGAAGMLFIPNMEGT